MDWEREHRLRVEANARKVSAIYEKAVQEAALIGATVTNFDPDRPFSFDDYAGTKQRIDKLMTAMATQIQATVVNGSTAEWEQSNFKNNELARSVLGYNRPTAPGQQLNLFSPPPEAATNPSLAKYFQDNTKARNAFLKRKTDGMDLSTRVWKYTGQFKTELEMSLDDGIRNGHPAATMARELRKFLVEPDRVYRRFQMNLRDANGNDILDRNGNKITFKQQRRRYIDPDTGQVTWRVEADIYKPGQGVYKSSLRNSQRVSRTENNMAYRTADHTRMQQMDFIVGQEITLSNAHLVYDICNLLQGKYPKEFFYKGWHPHCFCPVKFILKTIEELKVETEQILNGLPTTSQSVNQVTQMPDGFKKWVADNEERVLRARTTPYFIADNFIQGDITNGMTYEPTQARIAAQNARDAAAENDRVQAAIRKEAERVRIAEAARIEAARIEAARIEAERLAEAARIVEAARIARNARAVANRNARNAARAAEAARIAEIARLIEEARLAQIEADRQEAARVAALRSPSLMATIARAQRKISEARALNAIGPQLDALVLSISVPNPSEANIKYRIVQMTAYIKRLREAAAAAASGTAPAAPTLTAAQRRRIDREAAALAALQASRVAATGTATITAATTEIELLAILKAKLAANRASGYQGNYMDWWTGFANGGNVRSGYGRRDELLRGIRRMEEFADSHRTGNYTSDALSHFKGKKTIPPPPPPYIPTKGKFNLTNSAITELKKRGWTGLDSVNLDDFNKLMEGFDMIKLDEEIMAFNKKYDLKIVNKSMSISGHRFGFSVGNGLSGNETRYHVQDGIRQSHTVSTKQFYLNRSFRVERGIKWVEHDYLTIPEKQQGNNLTKELFSSLYRQYNNAGVDRIHVHANISVGSYAWGRYGFVADDGQRSNILDICKRYMNSTPGTKTDITEIINYIDSRPPGENIDMNAVTAMPGAKEMLMWRHWYGFIDLRNKDRVKIFEKYLAQRK